MAWERVKSVRIGGRQADVWKSYNYGRWKYEVSFRRGDNYVEPSGMGLLSQKAALEVARRDDARGNPSKSVTLRNMASVTIQRLPGGAVKVSGRKMGGRRNPPKKRAKRAKKR